MKKLLILLVSIFIIHNPSFANSNFTQANNESSISNDIHLPPENVKLSDPNEAVWMYVVRRIDAEDVPPHIKEFANRNLCFYVVKSYHWSSPAYNYGNVYKCSKNNKCQYIIEKDNKIKFANFFLRKKLHVQVYGD